MNDDVHAPRKFQDVKQLETFRTGHANLMVWVKESDCCGRPLQGGGASKKFSPSQTVYVIKSGRF